MWGMAKLTKKTRKISKKTRKRIDDAVELQHQMSTQTKRAEATLFSRMSKRQRLEIMDHVAISRYLVGEDEHND